MTVTPPLEICFRHLCVTVSWTTPQFAPTNYILTSVCALLCNDTPFLQTTSTPGPTDTLAGITGLLPGSECNISLTGYDTAYDYLPTVASATTNSESEFYMHINLTFPNSSFLNPWKNLSV